MRSATSATSRQTTTIDPPTTSTRRMRAAPVGKGRETESAPLLSANASTADDPRSTPVNRWSVLRVSKRDSLSRGVFLRGRGAGEGGNPDGQSRRPGPTRLELLDRTVDARYRLREAGCEPRTERRGENFRRGLAG